MTNNDDFSQKEIIQQLLVEMRELRSVLSEHKELINKQTILNAGRDSEIADLRKEMRELASEVHSLRSNFDFFKFKVTLVAGIIATAASIVGNRLLDFFL